MDKFLNEILNKNTNLILIIQGSTVNENNV